MSYRRRLMRASTKIPDYLCFTALEDGTFTFTYGSAVRANGGDWIEYSTNGVKWNRLTSTDFQATSITTPSIRAGKQVYWRGSNTCLACNTGNNTSTFSSSCKFNVSGNLGSLFNPKDFENITMRNASGVAKLFIGSKVVDASEMKTLPFTVSDAYRQIFDGCTNLVSAPILPTSTVTGHCFQATFRGCTALVSVPFTLNKVTKVTCYHEMFKDCTSLTTAPLAEGEYPVVATQAFGAAFMNCTALVNVPDIYLTTIEKTGLQHCQSMFEKCTALKRNPIRRFGSNTWQYCYMGMFRYCKFDDWGDVSLPEETLSANCYNGMFRDTNITYIKMLAKDVSASSCLNNWLSGAPNSSSCIFVKHIDATWTNSGASGVPSDWKIIYYDPTLDKYYLDQNRSTECDDHGNVIN